MELPPKYCPECGEEYVHSAARCADCGVALALEPQSSESRVVLPGVSELVAVRTGDVRWIRGLAARLSEAGIPSRVERPQETRSAPGGAGGGGGRATLYVQPTDATQAGELDAEFARTQIPDLPEDATAHWVESDDCPACGSPLSPEASECPDCGLVIAAAEG